MCFLAFFYYYWYLEKHSILFITSKGWFQHIHNRIYSAFSFGKTSWHPASLSLILQLWSCIKSKNITTTVTASTTATGTTTTTSPSFTAARMINTAGYTLRSHTGSFWGIFVDLSFYSVTHSHNWKITLGACLFILKMIPVYLGHSIYLKWDFRPTPVLCSETKCSLEVYRQQHFIFTTKSKQKTEITKNCIIGVELLLGAELKICCH